MNLVCYIKGIFRWIVFSFANCWFWLSAKVILFLTGNVLIRSIVLIIHNSLLILLTLPSLNSPQSSISIVLFCTSSFGLVPKVRCFLFTFHIGIAIRDVGTGGARGAMAPHFLASYAKVPLPNPKMPLLNP